VLEGCLVCQKVNKQVQRVAQKGERGLRPCQSIQVDFTDLPSQQRWKHLLVVVDHLARWVEACPVVRADGRTVARVLVERIVPRFRPPEVVDSDQGPHVIAKSLKALCEALGTRWEHHTPWHPQSSGRVERMNQMLKTTLTKLMMETELPWIKCLPLALFRIRAVPRKDLCISPHEMLFGMPYPLVQGQMKTPNLEVGEKYLREYVQMISTRLEKLREQGLLPQTVQLESKLHKINSGDWVLVKAW
ncbi:TF29 protein, partial [Formicarius rufipectus]|nr:TF29 protein [Formicarius rufipectus]